MDTSLQTAAVAAAPAPSVPLTPLARSASDAANASEPRRPTAVSSAAEDGGEGVVASPAKFLDRPPTALFSPSYLTTPSFAWLLFGISLLMLLTSIALLWRVSMLERALGDFSTS